jgi:hypothetical protein
LLGVVYALQKWRHLLIGTPFTLHTDQAALKYLLTSEMRTSRQERWLSVLMEFMPDIRYVKGPDNVVADALSRRADLVALQTQALFSPQLHARIAAACVDDPDCASLLAKGTLHERGGLFYTVSDRLYVPPGEIRTLILTEGHAAVYRGHLGVQKTKEFLSRYCWWPGFHKSIGDFVATCPVCQLTKGTSKLPFGLLTPLSIPTAPWQSVSLDLITDLPVSNGFDSITVVVDRLTKMLVCIPCNKSVSAPQLAQLFVDNVVRRFGMPEDLVSDRDPRFTSHFWRSLMELLGTKFSMSTAAHPQSDGQTERANRTLEDMLRGFVSTKQRDWSRVLSVVELAYNNSIQASTLHTPFFLNHGRHPRTPFSAAIAQFAPVPAVSAFVEGLQEAIKEAQTNMHSAQQRQKSYADGKRQEHPFQVGQQVLLAIRPHQLPPGVSSKLSAKFSGPFPIIAAVGKNAFKLGLPAAVNIHPVFHVSQLKPYLYDTGLHPVSESTKPGPLYTDKKGDVYEVERILGKSMRLHNKSKRLEYLVKWKGYPLSDASWEPFAHVKHLAEDCQLAPYLSSEEVKRLASA